MHTKISVIMGVYNCESTIKQSIECIINQTESNWELIICDDGSIDNTFDIVQKYSKVYPNKIIALSNDCNKGLNYSLNRCLKIAKGSYIARMDGDDLCSPNRFEEELNILENNPDIAIVSTGMEYFDETGVWGRYIPKQFPETKDFVNGTPFCHAPCMVRKEAYLNVQGYTVDDKLLRVEDYHLWIKMYAAGYKGMNIQKALYQMRDDRNAYRRRKFRFRLNESCVRCYAIKQLNLSKIYYIYTLVPIVKGIIPEFAYKFIHKFHLRKY